VFSGAKGTVYFVRETRSGDEIADFLEDFAGVIVTDGHAGYDALAQKLLRALCLLHLRRNMKCLEAKNVARGKALARDLTWWLDAAITLVGQRSELSEEFFVQQARDLEEQFFEILSVRTSSPSNIRMVSRMLKWQDAISSSLRDPRVPATNNQAERRIRPAVVLRKRGGCNRSERGARTFERLASIAVTLRQQGRSFMGWIASLLVSPTPPPLFA
jgi:transposase